jgi:DnaJ family protein A protein 2
LKVAGEGMPLKKSDAKGDLYLVVKIDFPEDNWTEEASAFTELKKILPKPAPTIEATEVDEVEFDSDAEIEDVSLPPFHFVELC